MERFNTENRFCEAVKASLLMMLGIRGHFTLHTEGKSKKREMERERVRQRKRDTGKKGRETERKRQMERGRLVESKKEMGKMVTRRRRWRERWGDCKRVFQSWIEQRSRKLINSFIGGSSYFDT